MKLDIWENSYNSAFCGRILENLVALESLVTRLPNTTMEIGIMGEWRGGSELAAGRKLKTGIPRADEVVPDRDRSDGCHSLRIRASDIVRSSEFTGRSLRDSTTRFSSEDGKSLDSRSSEALSRRVESKVKFSRRKPAKAVLREPTTSSNSWKMDLERQFFDPVR